MLNKEGIAELKDRLAAIRIAATSFFHNAEELQEQAQSYSTVWDDVLNDELRAEAEDLRAVVKRLSVDIAGAVRGSPLVAEADLQDLRHNTRQMLASLRFRRYRHRGVVIHHDEDVVLGVDPPSQEEEPLTGVRAARVFFDNAAEDVGELVEFLSPAESIQTSATGTASYRPNTAFVMMAIDKNNRALEDIKNTIRDVCKEFGITATTADDIEHEGSITDRVLEEIESNEFLIADLTGERPNVYYEIGHAHARDKRVHLFCQIGTKVHFDVAHRKYAEYENITDLKKQLRKRLATITNKLRKA